MSQLSKIPPSESKELSLKSCGSIILNELPTEQVLTTIAGLLHDTARLYQIQNWDKENSAHLASWILRTYKYEQLQDIVSCLQNPPEIYNERGEREKIWRLTPDTVRAWYSAHLDKLLDAREKEIENQRKAEGQNIAPEILKVMEAAVKNAEPERKKIPIQFKRLTLYNVDGMEIEAYTIEEARQIQRKIIEEQIG